MRNWSVLVSPLLLWAFGLFPCFGQFESQPRLGVGVKMSSLGAGIEAATAVTRRSNVRVGFNIFNYGTDFTKDGIHYGGDLSLRSLQVLYDQYLIGPLHVSPGLLLYNGNQLSASASVPGGQSFSLGGTGFVSSAADPVHGTGYLNLGTTSPMVLIGVGNLLPRSRRHFAVNFEAGVIFQRTPQAKLTLNGSACIGAICQPAASNPLVENGIQAEQDKINRDLDLLRFYPVISVGFGYKF